MRTQQLYILILFSLLFHFISFSQNKTNAAFAYNGTIIINGPDTVCEGTSGFMTLTGASAAPVYWQVSTNNGLTWSNIPNTSITNTYFMAMNNLCYRAILANNDTTHTACLKVDKKSSAGNITGAGVFCNTANGTLKTIGASGTSIGWYTVAGNNFTPIGNTSLSQVYTNLTQAVTYAFIAKNGVCPADTKRVVVMVDPISDAGLLKKDTSVCISSNLGTLQVINYTGNILGWQTSINAGASWTNNGNLNATNNFLNLTQNTSYRLIVKSGICPADTSNMVTVNVDQLASPGILSGGGVFCGVPASGILSLNNYNGTISNWESSIDNGTTWNNLSLNTGSYPYTNISQTTYYKVKITSGSCPLVYSNVEKVLYSPLSNAGILSAIDTYLCEGDSAYLSLNGFTGNQFLWQSSVDAGNTWINLLSSGSNLTLKVLNDAVYRVVVSNNFCSSVASNTLAISVKPMPTLFLINKDTVIHQGDAFIISATGTGAPQWSPLIGIKNPTSFSTMVTPSATTAYVITSSIGNCKVSDTLNIKVLEGEFDGATSNILTPNGDGINDVLYFQNIEAFQTSEITIFNEYGQMVYNNRPYNNDWKGLYNNSRLPDGVYYYVLKFSDKSNIIKGSVTLTSQK